MEEMVLPEIDDLAEVIADYLDTLAPDVGGASERASIIGACLAPFSCLIETWELALAQRPVERMIWRAFMQDLFRMSMAERVCTAEPEYSLAEVA